MKFKEYLLFEVAKGLKDLQFNGTVPNFQVQIADKGVFVRLYVRTPRGSKFAGDLNSHECFGNSTLLPGYKLFAWHSDINKSLADGFGPFLYDIAMEIATTKGGYLVSHALVNRLIGRHLEDDFAQLKGGSGGDPTDEAEEVYKYYHLHRKHDVESIKPNIIKQGKEFLADQQEKPHMYELYRKQPNTINTMIELNKQGKIVLTNGLREPILNLNF